MQNDKRLYYDDLEVGAVYELGSFCLSREEIIDFAHRYDPQAFHLTDVAGEAVFGGLAASGLQTAGCCHRLLVDGFLKKTICLGSSGVDEMRFYRPVYADRSFSVRMRIIDKHPLEGHPDRGALTLECQASGKYQVPVYRSLVQGIFSRRPA